MMIQIKFLKLGSLVLLLSWVHGESKCQIGCNLAMAAFYINEGTYLTNVSALFNTQVPILLQSNPEIDNPNFIKSGKTVRIPFSCDCINGDYLGHTFHYVVKPNDTYWRISLRVYQKLTTIEWMERVNSYPARSIPIAALLNVTVNCSCGVSSDDGLFLTYPLVDGDTLDGVAKQFNVKTRLLQRYNPAANFSAGEGLVFIPLTGKDPSAVPQLTLEIILPGVAMIGIIIFVVIYRKKIFLNCKSDNTRSIEIFIENYVPSAPTRYTYRELHRITNSFKIKLGEGGFGIVFKGDLRDGCQVAVKILKETKGNRQDFINEVAAIGRTSHTNIVKLVGFCYERSKKALVYELMPNGSLEKIIFSQGSRTNQQLSQEQMFEIAVGTARGLEYLHHGCNTRILHLDIKPHNILLDQDFCPKISDFGLAKLFSNKQSIISMTGARGTFGYMAPEVFSRNFGRVSYKSDVYSYGMLLLEIVGGRKNFDERVENSSEVYFPHWIYDRLDQRVNAVVVEELTIKMIKVGLWCIQVAPGDRPSMSKVVEMLEGNLESLQVPPKPVLFSPPRAEELTQVSDPLS